jgi:HNH endonuclease
LPKSIGLLSRSFSIEHIIPRSRGGTNELDNLAIACQGCNNSKYSHIYAIDPITGGSAPLYHPRQDRWKEHFGWSDDYAQLVGLTMVGRATIERMQLNREGVVNLRRLLYSVNRHPPNL